MISDRLRFYFWRLVTVIWLSCELKWDSIPCSNAQYDNGCLMKVPGFRMPCHVWMQCHASCLSFQLHPNANISSLCKISPCTHAALQSLPHTSSLILHLDDMRLFVCSGWYLSRKYPWLRGPSVTLIYQESLDRTSCVINYLELRSQCCPERLE